MDVGQRVVFGGYEWMILDIQDRKALMLSDKILMKMPYNNIVADITWECCSLREYLNDVFINKFSEKEKSTITETILINNDNWWHGTEGGNPTSDKIFLLSIEEIVRYFGDSGKMKKDRWIADQYNPMRIAFDESQKAWWWWLRTPGFNTKCAVYVDSRGVIYDTGTVHVRDAGVRPAFWLKL